MFKLARERKVWWDVDITVPKDRGVDVLTTSWLFDVLDEPNLKTLLASGNPAAELGKHVHGWEGIAAEDGTPLPFSEENRQAVLRILFIQTPVAAALIACSRGAAPKNSNAGSAG